MTTSTYEICSTYEEALANTTEGWPAFAVMLVHVITLPDIDAELGLGDDHYPYVLAAMTTKFTDEDKNEKLGWSPIEGELRQMISQMLHDAGLKNQWVYLSQQVEELGNV